MSRTTSSDHLSPKMSSELATAQAERAKGFAVFMCPALHAVKASDLQSASHCATVPRNLQNASDERGEHHDSDSPSPVCRVSAPREIGHSPCRCDRTGRVAATRPVTRC